MIDLFTVLIAEKEHIDAIQKENKLFFEPFLENKELAFCMWNPAGQSLYDSVPGLLDAVGRRKNWRAVIINNCTPEALKTRNPFDVVDHRALSALVEPVRQLDSDSNWDEWESAWANYHNAYATEKTAVYKQALEFPLQKLVTWLCFKPEDYILNEVQEKQDVHDWAMKQLGRDDIKASAKLELLEHNQYKNSLRVRENLRREFISDAVLNIAHPSEVHCISPRTAENGFFDPDAFWTVRSENEYSAFADRNMYFDKMRFLVFDLLPQSHRNFRTDYIRFLASVLIFISNPVPSGAMQARHLYQLETETDDTPLCTLVTSYDRKLSSTFEVIDAEMEKIRSEIPAQLTDKAAEEIFCASKDIDVVLDASCKPDKALAETDYGLFFDSPEDEYHKWNRDRQTSDKELAYIMKQQSRSVRKGVNQMHLTNEASLGDVSRLTSLQLDDVQDYADAAEDEMVASIPPDFSDMSAYKQQLLQQSEAVKKTIGRRMTKKTTFVLGSICLLLYFLCFVPFLFSNNGTSRTTTTAVVLCVSMLAVLAAIMLVALFFLRTSIVQAVRNYNTVVRDTLNDIQASMERFSKYLSATCNVCRGHSILNSSKKDLDEYTKSLRIRKKHQEDIRKKRACLLEDYRDYFGDHSYCDETMARPYNYDFDLYKEYDYPAPFLAGDCRQIEFLSNGNFVTVPSSYVTRILIRAEGIYEK